METIQSTEIYSKVVLAGDIESVRARVLDAVETLGYDIIEEEPNILVRREPQGWGTAMASANILDYGRSLTIRLKSISQNSTSVIFDYAVKHSAVSKGDKAIILQEAKTIAAISKIQAVEKLCSVCETESTDDSKFCRKCGAPLTSEHAEIEVLRILGETRAAKVSTVTSSISLILSTLTILLAFILNNAELIKPKLFPLLLVFGGIGVFISICTSISSWSRLKSALDIPETPSPRTSRNSRKTLETEQVRELPSYKTPASVTEGTTNLLDEEWANRREKEKVPVSNRRTTNDLD